MTTDVSTRAPLLWTILLTAASTATTLVLACATPFAALAALAALHLRRREGMMLMILAWAASQIVGFGLLGYPHTPGTFLWGAGLATASLGAASGAYAARRLLGGTHAAVQLGGAYLAAFVSFKLVVLLWALGLGGVDIVLAPDLLLRQFTRDGAILLFLLALYHALVLAGVPAAQPRRQAA